jgi:hypothetical protein
MWKYQYPDELYHWKYISKKRVNGKWRYTYDTDLDNAYKTGEKVKTVESERFGDNGYVTRAKTVTYKDSNSLFSKTEKVPTHTDLKGVKGENGKFTDLYTERVAMKRSRGVLERSQAKAEKYIAVYYPERYVKKYDQEVENAGSNERDFFTEFLKKKAGQHHNSNGGQKREK